MKTVTVNDAAGICSSLAGGGYSIKFRGYSAIDLYMGNPAMPFLRAQTNADIAILAKHIDDLRFPGVEIADAAADTPDGTIYFSCLDSDGESENNVSFPLLSFGYNCRTGHFEDPLGIYPQLRALRGKIGFIKTGYFIEGIEENEGLLDDEDPAALIQMTPDQTKADRYRIIMDSALLLARYGFGIKTFRFHSAQFIRSLDDCLSAIPPGPEAQRAFLSCLLVSPRPDLGLDFLKRSLFVEELWPELAGLDDVDHSKEFHPEGNVWKHTLETFRHRKAESSGAYDLRLSLGLLLHDAGKPISASNGSHRFNGHAELGARAAARFLERLEFEPALVADIFYLVKNHMLPAALKRLPVTKTAEIMASPLFPTLLELYRCDESSSFKGMDEYHENTAAYQAYLKNIRNPYRSADGKKIAQKTRSK